MKEICSFAKAIVAFHYFCLLDYSYYSYKKAAPPVWKVFLYRLILQEEAKTIEGLYETADHEMGTVLACRAVDHFLENKPELMSSNLAYRLIATIAAPYSSANAPSDIEPILTRCLAFVSLKKELISLGDRLVENAEDDFRHSYPYHTDWISVALKAYNKAEHKQGSERCGDILRKHYGDAYPSALDEIMQAYKAAEAIDKIKEFAQEALGWGGYENFHEYWDDYAGELEMVKKVREDNRARGLLVEG